MRILMWVTIGFGGICGLLAYELPPVPLTFLLTAGGLSTLAGLKWKNARRAALVFLGCILGLCWFQRFTSGPLRAAAQLDGKTREAVIRISDFAFETPYGTGAEGVLRLDGRELRVRVYLDGDVSLVPGQEIRGSFRFRKTVSEESSSSQASRGILLLAYPEGEVDVGVSDTWDWRDFPPRLRFYILAMLDEAFPADTAPFAKALLLGYTADLSYELDTSFKISGIRHVVAVSGLHVSILFALLSTVTFRKRFLTVLVGIPTLFLFAAVAGFTPSVTRASIMAELMLLALLFDREYDGPTALAFAALTMLVWNPLVITDIGFQLSVASVAGIYLFNTPIYDWLKARLMPGKKKSRIVRWFCTSVSISLSAMSLTTPLCAWHFGTVSLVGPLTNLLTLWLISAIFYGLMGVCLMSLFWQTGAATLAWLLSLAIRYIQFTAGVLSQFPLAAVYTASPYIIGWLVFIYILLGAFLLMHDKKPRILLCCGALGLCFALLASFIEPMLDENRFTALDVGQGQCLILQNGGRTYMVDCGGSSDRGTADMAAETLLSQGIDRIDGLIFTHTDRDHAGAAQNFLSRIPADILILPPVPGELETEGQRIYATEDLILQWDGGSIRIFSGNYPDTDNENSLCVLFESEKCDILITGDRNAFGERMLLRQAALSHVDVLIAGHHGSGNSTCDELLSAVTPETVIISAGKDNPYGHPAPELLERLQKYGCEVYRTDQNGTILIRR